MIYSKRTTEPKADNLCWISETKGGANKCISVDAHGSTIPNCTGYAWGRWVELLGKRHKLSVYNAGLWYLNSKSDGYARNKKIPKLGSVACWSLKNSTNGEGHVGIVEEIYIDGSFLMSDSSYKGDRFRTTVVKPDFKKDGYSFQGFIYIPKEFNKTKDEIANEVIRGLWGNGTERKNKLEAAGYNYKEIQNLVNTKSNSDIDSEKIEIAKRTYRGEFGNGIDRIKNLTKMGYDYNEIQNLVNDIYYSK